MRLPGLDAIGCGYQTVTGQFASIDSCEEQLFDFDKIGYTTHESTATGKTYDFPKKFVQYLDKNTRESETITGETVDEFVKRLSTSVEIEAHYSGFGGSIKADFSEASERSNFESYTRLQYNTTFWRLSLDDSAGDHRDFLKDQVREDIDKLDANVLYDRYGTHYVNDITVGGRCVSSAITNRLICSNSKSFGVYLKAKFEMGAFGASASSSVLSEEGYKNFNENSKFNTKITGGDPAVYGSDVKPNFDDWAKTVKDHPMMIDFASHNGLIPLWKLAKDDDRKMQLKDAMDEYFKTHQVDFNVDKSAPFLGRWIPGRVQFNDDGSGATRAFTVYKPDLSDGWYWLGQRGFGPEYPPSGKTFDVLAIKPKPFAKGALVPIKSFSKIWDDAGSKKVKVYHIFRPVSERPVDYVPLSHFFIVDDSDSSFPTDKDTEGLMAVHREFVVQASVGGKLWTDEGTRAYARGSCWQINPPNDGVDGGFWVGHNDYSEPSAADAFALKKSAIEFI